MLYGFTNAKNTFILKLRRKCFDVKTLFNIFKMNKEA